MKKISLNLSPYKFKSHLICPFGPRIGHFRMNEEALTKLLSMSDEILQDNTRVSHGNKLAGQIEEEPGITIDMLKEANLYDFFLRAMTNYVELVDLGESPEAYQIRKSREVITNLVTMWVVSQYENEYNPIHWHPGCTISGTLYLKVPEFQDRKIHQRKEKKNNEDGNIIFVNNNPSDPCTSLENATFAVKPKVGDMFLWPSRLMHCVYPFQGSGERRSIAFNGIHHYV